MNHQTPTWIRDYLDIPWAERGESRDGASCYGLIRLVHRERLGIALPDLDSFDEGLRGDRWSRVDAPSAIGDIAVFSPGTDNFHVAMAVSDTRMLHVVRESQARVEEFGRAAWKRRLDGWYSFRGAGASLTARAHPFGAATTRLVCPEGTTIAEMVRLSGLRAASTLRVWISGSEVPRAMWGHTRPLRGTHVAMTAIPQGGESGDPARVFAMLAVVAVAIVAPYAAGLTAGSVEAALLSGAVLAGGSLAVNALIPAPSADPISYAIRGARNEMRPYAPIPQVLGDVRMVPPFAARPYTEIVGSDQYLRLLYTFGYGPLEISELKIGETDLADYDGVEYEIHTGSGDDPPSFSLYPSNVFEEALSVALEGGIWQQRTTTVDADEISIDISFLFGLVTFDELGNRSNASVAFQVEYKPEAETSWRSIGNTYGAVETATQMRFMTREPTVTLEGSGQHTTSIDWHSSPAGTWKPKPSYLPTDQYSWVVEGYILVPELGGLNVINLGLDSSGPCDLYFNDQLVLSRYGAGQTAGVSAPDFSDYVQLITPTGWRKFMLRMQAPPGEEGAIALGWKHSQTGDAWQVIPAGSLFSGAAPSLANPDYRYFDTSDFGSIIVVEDRSVTAVRRNVSFAPHGEGPFDVRIQRTTADSIDERVVDAATWTALRSITADAPIQMGGISAVALRIKASDQLQGVVESFNARVRSIVLDYAPDQFGTWLTRASSNPASLYRHVLQGAANKRPIADAKIDIDRLEYFHAKCAGMGLEFNGVFDFRGTVFERLRDIATAGRASAALIDGLYSVVIDEDKTDAGPVQHFTPRNSRDFSGRKVFVDRPHALRVGFLNKDADYQRDERLVLDDGYQIDGLDAFGNGAPTLPEATKLETLEIFGVTSAEEAFKHGRYTLAVSRLRPEVFELTTDVEHLVCNRGDLVMVSHDVPLFGLGFGRIIDVEYSGAAIASITLDEPVPMVVGGAYSLRVRLDDGSSWLEDVDTINGETRVVTFTPPVGVQGVNPQPGDLWMFGEKGIETRDMVVARIDIEPSPGMAARLTLVDHAPEVHLADQGTIPDFDSGINNPPSFDDGPEDPVIESIRSDDYVMARGSDGTLIPRMLVQLETPSSIRPIPVWAQAKIREKPGSASAGGAWTTFGMVPLENFAFFIAPVEEGVTYQIRIRVIDQYGRASGWVDAEHTVIGKVLPPPDVDSFSVFRLGDGTRRYVWDLGVFPPDVAGVRIQYVEGTGGAWDDMSPLHDDLLQGSPQELNRPPAGTYTFGIKMVDTSGNESTNALTVEKTLGPPRRENVAVSEDARLLGWPGTKTDCQVVAGDLEADDAATWDTLSSTYGIATWDDWDRWNVDPASPIVYEHSVIDAGFVFAFEPDVEISTGGSYVVEFKYSEDNVTWTDYEDLAALESKEVIARYVQFRVTVTAGVAPADRIPTITQLVMFLRAKTIEQEIDDLDMTNIVSDYGAQYRVGNGAGQIRVPIDAGRFSVIRSVSVGFNGVGAGYSWEIVDKDVTVGPHIRVYDADGTLANITIDVTVRGLA